MPLFDEWHYTRGTVLTRQSHILHQAIYIKKGAARVYFIEKGKEHTTSFAFADEYLTARFSMAAIGKPDTELYVMFIEDTDVIFIPQARIMEILAIASLETQVKMLKLINTSIDQLNATLESRLYHLLHSSALERYRWAISIYPRLLEIATTSQIASFLGLSRETVTRIRNGQYNK
jgi:CRP-like cAMP-binding protein